MTLLGLNYSTTFVSLPYEHWWFEGHHDAPGVFLFWNIDTRLVLGLANFNIPDVLFPPSLRPMNYSWIIQNKKHTRKSIKVNIVKFMTQSKIWETIDFYFRKVWKYFPTMNPDLPRFSFSEIFASDSTCFPVKFQQWQSHPGFSAGLSQLAGGSSSEMEQREHCSRQHRLCNRKMLQWIIVHQSTNSIHHQLSYLSDTEHNSPANINLLVVEPQFRWGTSLHLLVHPGL